MKPFDVAISNEFVKDFKADCAATIPSMTIVEIGTAEEGYTPFICSSSSPYDFYMLGVIVTTIVVKHAKLIQHRNSRNKPGSRSNTQ